MNRKRIITIISLALVISNSSGKPLADTLPSISKTLLSTAITVTNNYNTAPDSIKVTGLESGDKVNLYSVATSGTLLASPTVATGATSVNIAPSQLRETGGTIYVSVTEPNKLEGKRVPVKYDSEISKTLTSTTVTIGNQYGLTSDSITVTGLSSGDLVTVYSAPKDGKALVSGTVASNATSAIITAVELTSANVILTPSGGTVYLSVKKLNKAESTRTAIKYITEPVSAASPTITVTNNSTTSDSISVTGLTLGGTINVYSGATGGTTLESMTLVGETSATITTSKLNTVGGTIYVSVTEPSKLEGKRLPVKYESQISKALLANAVTIGNNYGTTSDNIAVTGLAEGDVINVYSAATGGTVLVAGTVSSGASSAIITAAELTSAKVILTQSGGTVYLSVIKSNKAESTRIPVKYITETVSTASPTITVTNNLVTSDSIKVTGLEPDDIVNLYSVATGGTSLASPKVAAGATSVNITSVQLKETGGTIYLSVKETDKLEGKRIPVKYDSQISKALISSTVKIDNNYGLTSDSIEVTGLTEGDVVNVYSTATGGTVLVAGTVSSGASSAIITATSVILTPSGGTVYLSVIKSNKAESTRIPVKYITETVSTVSPTITINNNSGTSDSINVTGLESRDTVKLYSTATGGTSFAPTSVADGATSVNITSVQLTETGGTIYLSVTESNKLEGKRIPVKYDSEISKALVATAVKIDNNYGPASDSITVTGLDSTDVVKLYSDAISTTAIVTSGTASSVTIAGGILTSTGGTVYISVTKLNKAESARTAIKYNTEPVSTISPTITVTNDSGTSDSIAVTGLVSGCTITVYSLATSGEMLVTKTLISGETSASITTNKLNTTGGTIYVSVAEPNKLEGKRIPVKYDSEISKALVATAVKIDNKYGTTSDSIVVTSLDSTDVVKLYSDAISTTAIVTSGTASSATIAGGILTSTGGTVYISVTKLNKAESARTAIKYNTEPVSTISPTITVTNDSGTSDSIAVTGLVSGCAITVYSLATSGEMLGTKTLISGETSASITTNKLNATGGTIYVSVAEPNKLEGKKIPVQYASEVSKALVATAVKIDNNYGTTSDSVVVTGLDSTDVVKLYSDAISTTAIVTSGTASSATIAGGILTSTGGTVYISVAKLNKAESARTAIKYNTEPVSIALSSANIIANNNYGTASDNIVVNNLTSGDIVYVFSSATDLDSLLKSYIVESGQHSATIYTDQLIDVGGTIYVSVKNIDKLESARVTKQYDSEASTVLPSASVKVYNNYGIENDSISVTNLSSGDIVNVYSVATGGIGVTSIPVLSSESSITLSSSALKAAGFTLLETGGTVYVSVIKSNKGESATTSIKYASEPISSPLTTAAITVSNTTGTDSISVTGLSTTDVVNVYNAASGGVPIATIANGDTSATIPAGLLAAGGGTVYVSIKNKDKLESKRTIKTYTKEQ